VPSGRRTGKDQVQPRQWGCSLVQSLPNPYLALALPAQKDGREVRIERKLVLRVFGLHRLDATVNDSPNDFHAQVLEVDVLPLIQTPSISGRYRPPTNTLLFSLHSKSLIFIERDGFSSGMRSALISA
jgi:hypothetical protein